jgi:MFS family permease
MPADHAAAASTLTTDVPARLDRLPWSRFHWLVVAALGITWILDGLEVTLVGSLSGAIADPRALGLSNVEIGLSASMYIAGAVLGALFFGWLADRYGRKRLFTITVGVYLAATIATGFSWDFWSFSIFRALTGAGIGGEYAAINSAIDELIPARRRGLVALSINGSFWVGAALGALGSIVVLDPDLMPPEYGWRLAFIIGGSLALIIMWVRRYIPESPRWLMTHGRLAEAERVIGEIESGIAARHGPLPEHSRPPIRLHAHRRITLWQVALSLFAHYPKRTVLGITLMATQAFCYNAIFFTYALILTNFYAVPAAEVGWYILPFAVGNFLGPLTLGHFFDVWGRKRMIAGTYALAGLLMAITGYLFAQGTLSAAAQTAAWSVIFFFASAAASSAYLTVSECFPLEARATIIALFYAFGTAVGGIGGPALFGYLIESGSRAEIQWGYFLGGALMLSAALVALKLAVAAECRPLEDVAPPLSQAM